ncbi:MAG: adenosylcobinamide-phosphate synthase CbiB [Lachnospiraceae bacterium]
MSLLAICLGFVLDLLLGDPHWLYHPVRLIGNLISILETPLRLLFPKNSRGEKTAGAVLAVLVTGITAAAAAGILEFAFSLHRLCGFAAEVLLCYWLFAVRSLKDESMKVYERLAENDTEGARWAVSMIVGRDTKNLTSEGIVKAAVETVAENTSDGIFAPMFYMILGGPVLGWIYKAVNTMDSMVGYKNEKYLYFGRCAAKLDDVLNFIPSRLCALFMIGASWFLRMDRKNAWTVFIRDRKNHASPNSAQTEAVMAGALDVCLAGDAWYFGELYHKPTIGDAIRPVETEDIKRANKLLYVTAILSLTVLVCLRILIQQIL